MTLHPVLEEKLNTALAPAMLAALTRRDAVLPDLRNKAHAITGMRRAGKTSFLRQLVAERQSTGWRNERFTSASMSIGWRISRPTN